jgi:glycosyltransferase involved in cell wall biosynthesis
VTKHPLVTVITPTYNRADYLSETIESVLGQDYPHIEYIVLDDGSTDNTREVLGGYTGHLVWESHSNMGETRTVYKGVEMAQGEYVVIVNSDDPILPGLIRETAECLTAHPDVLVAYPDWSMIDGQGNTLHEFKFPKYDYVNMLGWYWCQPGPGAMFRRDAWLAAGGRTSKYRYVADFELWLRLGLLGPFVHVPKTLATWRWHAEGASTSSRGLLMAREHISLIESVYARTDLPAGARKMRARAFSSAYCAAAEACLPSHRKEGCQYLLRSLQYHPLGPFMRPQRSLTSLVEILLGSTVANWVRSILRAARAIRSSTFLRVRAHR